MLSITATRLRENLDQVNSTLPTTPALLVGQTYQQTSRSVRGVGILDHASLTSSIGPNERASAGCVLVENPAVSLVGEGFMVRI